MGYPIWYNALSREELSEYRDLEEQRRKNKDLYNKERRKLDNEVMVKLEPQIQALKADMKQEYDLLESQFNDSVAGVEARMIEIETKGREELMNRNKKKAKEDDEMLDMLNFKDRLKSKIAEVFQDR